MKIRGWEIAGFGVLRDVVTADLPDGLTVVHGANEAGKSTLLEFLRHMLFGTGGGAGTAPFAPLGGGPFGGCLHLRAADGEYALRRDFAARGAPLVTRPDGSGGGAADLARLLGGADEKLFRAVFAFSIDDLQSLAGLDAAGLREALFSASLAGAGRSARSALAALQAQAAARLDGEGPSPITDRIAALQGLRPRLAAARRAALAYPELRQAAAAAAARADDYRNRRAALAAERERGDALLRARPLWEALQAARAEHAALGDAPPPPPGSEAELQQANAAAQAARGAAEALAAEQRAAEVQLAALPDEDIAAACAADLDALCADLTLHRFQLATLPAARARAAEAEATLHARVQRLAVAADETALREWGRLGIDREQVRDWQARLQAAEERAQQAQLRADAAAQHLAAVQQRADAVAADLPGREPPARQVTEAQRRTLAALRESLEDMLDKRVRGEAMAQTLQEREQALRALDAEPDGGPPLWLAPLLGGGSAAALALAAWVPAGSAVPAALAAASALATGGGALHVARQRRAAAARAAERELARRALRSELEAARRGRDQAWHAAAELAEQMARDGEALGLTRGPTTADLDACARLFDAEDDARVQGAAARARLAEIEPGRLSATEHAAARAAERQAAELVRDAAEAEWAAWAARAGVGDAADPQLVLDRVASLQAAHGALLARDAAERELRQLAPMVAAWEARARAVLDRAGDPAARAGGGAELADVVVALRTRLQAEAPRRARRAALTAELRERAGRLDATSAAQARAEAAVAAVLARAGVRDGDELAARRAAVARREALARVGEERAALLAERAGWDGAAEEIGAAEPDLLRGRLTAVAREAEGLEGDAAAADAAARDGAAAVAALEASDEVPTLEGEWSALTAELEDAVRDWRLLAAAAGFVAEAVREFERTRQPAVLREASRAFAGVTAGRYERITQDERGAALTVVERGGLRKQAGGELSRGTTEQLYLAVRLGLAGELARRGTALPLIMDDVLVNFDPERAAAMAAVLGEAAAQHQVLFFTCHPGMRDLLVAGGQAARVVEL